MAVLPENSIDLSGGVEFVAQPSLTWKIDRAAGRIAGTCDGYDAVKQAVEIILNVERYRWQIYQPASGMQWEGLVGQDAGYVATELQRRLQDALLADDRIIGLKNYEYSIGSRHTTPRAWSLATPRPLYARSDTMWPRPSTPAPRVWERRTHPSASPIPLPMPTATR